MKEKTEQNMDGFINRDISWIEFNSRVLDEAQDPGNPLLERLNFIAITGSNLDEFCMVRLAGVASQLSRGYHTLYKEYGYEPAILMKTLKERIRLLVERQSRLLREEILPEMEQSGIRIALSMDSLTPAQKSTAVRIMSKEIFPVLTPIGIDPSHPFPLIPNLGLEMLIRLTLPGRETEHFAILEVPGVIPRFIQLESTAGFLLYIPAEVLIRSQLGMLFPGASIRECSCFRITRDMDFSIDEEAIADLMSELQSALRKKTKRTVVRLEYASDMSETSRQWLLKQLSVTPESTLIQSVDTLLNLKSLFELSSIRSFSALRNPPLPPLPHPLMEKGKSLFRTIREKGPFLLHHPYHSFDPVIRMLQEAADDPQVLAIKQTLYRVSGDSPVVHALIRAARNGKQVSVLVELKARFDEENNINWARSLAEAGAHVVYGIANLKVHCKALMVIRKEEEGIRRYVHLSTGNYNDKTAKLYTDLGYFSDDLLLAQDVSSLFNVITGFSTPPKWNKLLTAPFDLLEKILFLIDREGALSTAQKPGHIRIKVNSLIDYEVIEHLYRAAEKHVKIELIVRGICGLSPYSLKPESASNIRIVSVLDRFLEHERIYYFANNGSPEYYLGSADLMSRNLRRRIELLFPVDDPSLRKELDFILETNLADKRKGRTVCGINVYTKPHENPVREESRSQIVLYEYYRKRAETPQKIGEKVLTVFREKRRKAPPK